MHIFCPKTHLMIDKREEKLFISDDFVIEKMCCVLEALNEKESSGLEER